MSARPVEEAARSFDLIPYSRLSALGDCCGDARAALLSDLHVRGDGEVGGTLALVPLIKAWGPTKWPASWCSVAESPLADCGVHAALVSEVLSECGIGHARARLILQVSARHARVWRDQWESDGAASTWISDQLVHHEVIAVGDRLWDPTEARWLGGLGSRVGSGVLMAARIEMKPWQFITT